jgi:hypothetical protein
LSTQSFAVPIVWIGVTCLGASAALTGCFGAPAPGEMEITFDACEPLVVDVAPDATDEQRASIEDGIAMWNDRAGTSITTSPLRHAAVLPIRFDEAAPMFYGVYVDEDGEILINDGMTGGRRMAVTVAHELGHAFGMWHVSERVSVMNTGNLSVEPTSEDVARLSELWGPCPGWRASPDTR